MASKPAHRTAEATTHKVADIIRAVVKAEVDNIHHIPHTTPEYRYLLEARWHEDNFTLLLGLIQSRADHGSADCQQVLADLRSDLTDNLGRPFA